MEWQSKLRKRKQNFYLKAFNNQSVLSIFICLFYLKKYMLS